MPKPFSEGDKNKNDNEKIGNKEEKPEKGSEWTWKKTYIGLFFKIQYQDIPSLNNSKNNYNHLYLLETCIL